MLNVKRIFGKRSSLNKTDKSTSSTYISVTPSISLFATSSAKHDKFRVYRKKK